MPDPHDPRSPAGSGDSPDALPSRSSPSPSRTSDLVGRLLWRLCATACGAAIVLVAWLMFSGRWTPPYRWAFWRPLDLTQPTDAFTGWRLHRAQAEGPACLAALETDPALQWQPVPDRQTSQGCGLRDAVRLSALDGTRLSSPTLLSCRTALSLALWDRHGLQPAARLWFGSEVARIDHLGSYACRNINTGEGSTRAASSGRLSRHATADAIDVAGFTLANGRTIRLRGQWKADGVAGAFLADTHDSGCRWFSGVLGPDYNAVHADHLHLEVGGFGGCR